MPSNQFGNYVRERRMELGLTQEQLAERVGGNTMQSEISRLERGHVALPRRSRLEDLAGALEVSLGALLMHSGWLTDSESEVVDALPTVQQRLDHASTRSALDELANLREALMMAIERIATIEAHVLSATASPERPRVTVRTGVFDDWETSAVFND